MPIWIVGALGGLIAIAIPLRTLIPNGMDVSAFLAFGSESRTQTLYGQRLLGDVAVRPGQGHDGKFFFIQANDPLVVRPAEDAVLLDAPTYRAQRMLYPLIASGFGTFPPRVIAWSMLLTNMLALTIGTILTAAVASNTGLPTWFGLLFTLNIGLLFEYEIGGAGIVAFGFCMAAVLATRRERTFLASVLFVAAALTRETTLLFVLGVVVMRWLVRRRVDWILILPPIASAVLWAWYLRWRFAGVPAAGSAPDYFSAPFIGLWEAARTWTSDPWRLLTNASLLLIVILFVPIAWKGRLDIAWGALPFVALAIVWSVNVWRETFDLARVLAPVFTAAPFLVLDAERQPIRASAGRHREERDAHR